jgi:hypothetical protein
MGRGSWGLGGKSASLADLNLSLAISEAVPSPLLLVPEVEVFLVLPRLIAPAAELTLGELVAGPAACGAVHRRGLLGIRRDFNS